MPPSLKISINNLIWMLLLIFLSVGCGSQGSTPANKEGSLSTIKGVVTAESTITFKANPKGFKVAAASGTVPVPGAVCTIEGTDKSTTTDENGFFQITDVAEGSYILICKKTATDGKVYAFLEIVEVQDGETVDLGTVDIKKTGSIQGKATLADQTDHTGISIYIPGTSMQARTDATGAYLINDVPEGTYELRFEKSGYMTGKITGLPVTAGETALAEDMPLSLSTGASGIISIENGKVYSISRTVTVYITASDDAKLYQMSDNPNFIGAVWNPIPPSRTWIFDSDGEKRLYAKFADANGLESAPVSDIIIIDTTPPFNGDVSINNGALATNSTAVTLNLSATDATTSVAQMKISNDPDFTDTDWESFASTRSWVIPAGDGVKTVYVKYKDIVGNETTLTFSDDIILDTTIPASPSVTIQEGAYTSNSQIHLNLSASGATFMKISEDPTFVGIQAIPYASTMTVTLSGGDGDKTIYVKYIDDAGNESDLVSASVVLDTMPPVTPVIFNQNQTTNQTTFTMTLITPSIDTNFKVYQLKGGQYTDWTDTTEITTFNFTLTLEGANTLSIRGTDMAGNLSNEASVTITLDTNAPVLSNINASGAVTYATITWNTSEPTTGQVDFGLNEDYGSTVSDVNLTTTHQIILTDLSPLTIYNYRITSVDAVGNTSSSTNLSFTTIKVKAISLGGGPHTCALISSGGVKCWGFNKGDQGTFGQLGDGTKISRSTPVDVVGLSSGVAAIEAGEMHSYALTSSGGVKCWGVAAFNYPYGCGSGGGGIVPEDVVGLSSGVAAITAGGIHVCALTSSGGVKCLQTTVGGGTLVDVEGLSSGVVAIAVGGLSNFTAGVDHRCAITSTGGGKCWGFNGSGQLGDGTTTSNNTPVDVEGLSSGVVAIAAGGDHTCALTSSGVVKCWGSNKAGQLGDGTTTDHYTPVDVVGLSSGVAAIAAGRRHTCVLTSSGAVKCWGSNGYGQLGDGTTTDHYTPVDVVGLSSGVVAIATGEFHTCALTSSGGVKCWGLNHIGQLGDGTTTTRLTPVDVVGLY